MSGVYARLQKINNAGGRSEYLKDEKRQEEIVLQKQNMRYSWEEHSCYEREHRKTYKSNNEALEIHIPLPNELYKDQDKLERISDDLVLRLVGENKDYEYAVHWNHSKTNLHIHILFSERENQNELVPKIYKKDQWRDKTTNRLAKANSDNAYLYAKKGDIQRDKDGKIKYNTDIFKVKDTRYIESSWIHQKNRIVESVLKEYGYDVEYFDKNSPYLAQKKLYKGASEDYLEKAKSWNKEVKEYNEEVKKHLKIDSTKEEKYREIKRELLRKIKSANAEEKKITKKAILIIRDMTTWVKNIVINIRNLSHQKEDTDLSNRWNEFKRQYYKYFYDDNTTELESKKTNIDNTNISMRINELNEKSILLKNECGENTRKKLSMEVYELEQIAYPNKIITGSLESRLVNAIERITEYGGVTGRIKMDKILKKYSDINSDKEINKNIEKGKNRDYGYYR